MNKSFLLPLFLLFATSVSNAQEEFYSPPIISNQPIITNSVPMMVTDGFVGEQHQMVLDGSMGEQHQYPGPVLGDAIDVDSFTPKSQSTKLRAMQQAKIKVELPERAEVYLLDQQMGAVGKKRTYVVPVPNGDDPHKYVITIVVVANGKRYYKRVEREDVKAGMILALKVESPKPKEDEPVQIKVEAKIEAPGGEPKADKEEEKEGEAADEKKDGADAKAKEEEADSGGGSKTE